MALENLLKVKCKEGVKDKYVNLTESQSRDFSMNVLSSDKQMPWWSARQNGSRATMFIFNTLHKH